MEENKFKGLHDCPYCNRKTDRLTKGACHKCYRRVIWKRKLVECKKCKRKLPMEAKGLCGGCYQSTFQMEKIKAYNYKKWHNISIELYRKITKQCLICRFDKVVDLHHLDKNKKNNSENNLIGLCPNHHKMIHRAKYRKEVVKELNKIFKERGLPEFEDKNPDMFYQNNPRK
jgi:hypothetical protein|tara:strand:- start:733 stop:1248 length:516 start_codon:yes stop_codon:yes gene_type:complete